MGRSHFYQMCTQAGEPTLCKNDYGAPLILQPHKGRACLFGIADYSIINMDVPVEWEAVDEFCKEEMPCRQHYQDVYTKMWYYLSCKREGFD